MKLTELPPKNKGIPGRVYVKIGLLVFWGWKMIGLKNSSTMFLDYMSWIMIGFPEDVRDPSKATTTFFLKNVITGNRKSLNMSLSI